MQLFSLYSENNECSYYHCTVKIMNAVILTGKIGKGRIKRKQNICNGVQTCIGLTSRSTAQRSDNYATLAGRTKYRVDRVYRFDRVYHVYRID